MCCSTGRCSAASSILPAMLENSWMPLKPSWVMHRSTSAMARCGFPNPIDMDAKLRDLEAMDIAVSVLSHGLPLGPDVLGGEEADEWAMRINDDLARIIAAYPGKFVGFGTMILGSAGTRRPAAHSTAYAPPSRTLRGKALRPSKCFTKSRH